MQLHACLITIDHSLDVLLLTIRFRFVNGTEPASFSLAPSQKRVATPPSEKNTLHFHFGKTKLAKAAYTS